MLYGTAAKPGDTSSKYENTIRRNKETESDSSFHSFQFENKKLQISAVLATSLKMKNSLMNILCVTFMPESSKTL